MQIQHLFFRKKMYYYVARVPQDLAGYFPVKTVWRSLKTGCLQAAKTLLKALEYQAERLYMQMRSGMLTDEQTKQLVAEFLHGELALAENDRAVGGNIRQMITASDQGIDFLSDVYSKAARAIQHDLARTDLAYGELIADAIIEQHGLNITRDTEEYRKLCREVMIAEGRRLGIESERTLGNYDSDIDQKIFSQYPVPKKKIKLSKVMEEYKADRISENKWQSPKTITDMESSYSLLLRIKGDFYLDDITYEFARDFRNTMMKLPANSNKGRFAGKTTQEILNMSDYKSMSVANLNKNIDRMADIVSYAIEKDMVIGIKNFFKGLNVVDLVLASEKRRPFTKQEIAQVLGYLLDALDKKQIMNDRRSKIHVDYVWIFLLGLYTGFRSNELCQLTSDDVMEFEGIHCLLVQHAPEQNKTAKNLQSRRIIPVPPQMIDLGFLEYARTRATDRNDRLWVSVSLDSFGKWNKNFGRNINQYIDNALGGQDIKICLHSTRHNLGNALDNYEEVDLKTIQDIKGHVGKSTEERIYLKKKLRKQLTALELLDYGLNLDLIKDRMAKHIPS